MPRSGCSALHGVNANEKKKKNSIICSWIQQLLYTNLIKSLHNLYENLTAILSENQLTTAYSTRFVSEEVFQSSCPSTCLVIEKVPSLSLGNLFQMTLKQP